MQGRILTPIIPFNLIVDTDVGLIRMINNKYHDKEVFFTGLLSAPLNNLIYLLYTRQELNPLSVVLKDIDDKETMDIYYEEFMKEEYPAIVSESILTDLFNATKLFVQAEGINPSILCRNDIEENTIKKLDFGGNINIVSGNYTNINIDGFDPLYVKNLKDKEFLSNIVKLDNKNIYVANYPFNFVEDQDQKVLLPDISILLFGHNQATITEVYNIDDSYIAKG